MEGLEGEMKAAKISRRTAKAAFTRAGKVVVHAMENTRTATEVCEALNKYKLVYEDLVVKHETYTQLIDDEAFKIEKPIPNLWHELLFDWRCCYFNVCLQKISVFKALSKLHSF